MLKLLNLTLQKVSNHSRTDEVHMLLFYQEFVYKKWHIRQISRYFYQIGRRKAFPCPECRAETKIPDRGAEAFTDNRYAEEMIRLMKVMQIGDICKKHKQPLVLFCNDKDCQEQICPACVLVKHKDHNIMDLTSKAEADRGKMADRKEKIRDISLLLGSYLAELNSTEDKINKETLENLDRVDETRERLHRHIQELHQKVTEETEAHKMGLLQIHMRNIEQLKATKDEVQLCKAQLDSFYVDVEKSINCLPDNAVVQNSKNVEQVFQELTRNEITEKKFTMMIREPKYEQPDLPAQLQMLETGRIRQVESEVETPYHQIALMMGQAKIKSVNCKSPKSVKTFFHSFGVMCLSKDGSIIMEGKKPNEDNRGLKCTRNGTNIWEVNIGQTNVYGLCCMERNKEYLINTLGRRLEVRDVTDGRVLYGCDIDFDPGRICSTDDGSVLVVNKIVNPRTLVKFKLTERDGVKLEKTDEIMNTQMDRIDGLTLLRYDCKKLVILTRKSQNMIQTINYETGAIEWKMVGEKIDGKVIRPFNVCHDDIHMFVTDYDNQRIIVVSPDGKVKQKLLDLPGCPYFVTFDVMQRKLIVNYYSKNEFMLNICDIEYITE